MTHLPYPHRRRSVRVESCMLLHQQRHHRLVLHFQQLLHVAVLRSKVPPHPSHLIVGIAVLRTFGCCVAPATSTTASASIAAAPVVVIVVVILFVRKLVHHWPLFPIWNNTITITSIDLPGSSSIASAAASAAPVTAAATVRAAAIPNKLIDVITK